MKKTKTMKKLLTTCLTLIALNSFSQWYYGAESGIFTGKTKVFNDSLNKNEMINYSSFFFNMPVGIKNDYNVLFESNIAYAGMPIVSLNIGYQLGKDDCNLQVLVGASDFIEVERKLRIRNNYSYNGIVRINVDHFFFQVHYSDKTTFLGLGFKAYIFE